LHFIINQDAEIKVAASLWDLATDETTEATVRKTGEVKVCITCIGPVGERKGLIAGIIKEKDRAALDSACVCLFITRLVGPQHFAAAGSAVIGEEMNGREFLLAGERVWNLQTIFDNRAGLSRENDILPDRLMTEL
jgi:aldehyde:ferredoxin oxidoreductase